MTIILRSLLLGFWLIITQLSAFAADIDIPPNDLQQHFEARYQSFLAPNSQSLLPFAKMALPDWKALLAGESLKPVFSRPDVFYNNKTYVFTLYQAADGQYYLDAKGGFWGMDELAYGPIPAEQLQ